MKNIHEIEVKIEKEEWTKALDKSFEKAKNNVKVDGFRKGMVPRNIFEKKFGKESLYEEAINIVLPDAYDKVFKENKDLVPIIQPSIDIKEINEESVTFIFKITTKPEVKIKKYKGLNVKKEKAKVTKEEIDHQIEHLREQYADMVIKDGKIENGDTAVIDFEGFKDDVAFEGGKGENYPLVIGSNTFIPGFEEQLIGLKAGDEKDVLVTFPEEYASEELKGQKAVFKVKVHEVKTKELPEMNEEFFKDLGYDKVENEEQLRDLIKVDLEAKKDYENENKYVDQLLEEVAKNTEVELPEELVHEEAHHMVHNYEEQLKMQGITLEMFYQFTNSDEHALIEQMTPEAEKRVKYRFILEEIVKLENIEISDKEAEEHAEEIAKQYNMKKEDLLKEYGGIQMLKYDMQMQKALDVIKD
ncbi:MAG: trigger factor [Bacilli bacterium]|nr:trigger factor [Bacilli bacterium]